MLRYLLMEPPGLKRAPGPHGEKCENCRFMEWRESKPYCGKDGYPVMHWYSCDDWQSDGKLAPITPSPDLPIRFANRQRHAE